jgi:hypothetical protein
VIDLKPANQIPPRTVHTSKSPGMLVRPAYLPYFSLVRQRVPRWETRNGGLLGLLGTRQWEREDTGVRHPIEDSPDGWLVSLRTTGNAVGCLATVSLFFGCQSLRFSSYPRSRRARIYETTVSYRCQWPPAHPRILPSFLSPCMHLRLARESVTPLSGCGRGTR